MSCENKIDEFMSSIEKDKIMMETQFAHLESVVKEKDNLTYNDLVQLLSNFNTVSLMYNQLCNDLTLFISIFKSEDEQEIRIYKTEELVKLLQDKIDEVQKDEKKSNS